MAGSFKQWLSRTFGLHESPQSLPASPDVQTRIQKVVENAQREHQDLVSDASRVIGHGRDVEKSVLQQQTDLDLLEETVRHEGTLAARAEQAGDAEEATRIRQRKALVGDQLLKSQRALASARALLATANANSADARRRVEIDAARLGKLLQDRAGFLAQLEVSTVGFSITSAERRQALESGARPGMSTGSRTELQGRYRAFLRAANALPDSTNGRITTARIERIREAARQQH